MPGGCGNVVARLALRRRGNAGRGDHGARRHHEVLMANSRTSEKKLRGEGRQTRARVAVGTGVKTAISRPPNSLEGGLGGLGGLEKRERVFIFLHLHHFGKEDRHEIC